MVHKEHRFLFRQGLAIQPDPLAEIEQVRRGIQSGGISCFLKHRGKHVAYGAFAVGAGHVDRPELCMGMAHGKVKGQGIVQVVLVSRPANPLVHGKTGKEIFQDFLICFHFPCCQWL